jgi:hypothetical protein
LKMLEVTAEVDAAGFPMDKQEGTLRIMWLQPVVE